MVLRPMKIFSLRVIARRTSFSLTKTWISIAAFAGGSGFLPASGAGADWIGASAVFVLPEETAEEVSAVSTFGFADEPKKRSAISAAMDDGLVNSFAAGAGAG